MLCLSVVSLLACASGNALGQPCQPFWVGTGSPVRPIHFNAAAVYDDGGGPALYMPGHLTPGTGTLRGVARWDGKRWEVISDSLPTIETLGNVHLFHDGKALRLYFWAQFAGTQSSWLGYWNGNGWTEAPPGFVINPTTGPRYSFVSGSQWRTFGLEWIGSSFYYVVEWDGSSWSRRGGVFNQQPVLFAAFDSGAGPQLHVAGYFSSIGGAPATRIARWDGEQWRPLGSGVVWEGTPRAMLVHDDGFGSKLYLTDVRNAGGMSVDRIASWNGTAWNHVGGGILNTGITAVHVLASFDDGHGPSLIAGGYISQAGGGVPVRQIAGFRGGAWDDLGGGLFGGIPLTLNVFDDGRGPSLFVGGEFNTVAGGGPGGAARVAQFVGCQAQCYADCDNSLSSPRVNVDDFTCFINRYAIGDPYVDCNGDGLRTIADFHCFLARFAEGCM
jgi:hypothetical protein